MSSSSSSSSSSMQQPQPGQNVRKPAFANWPTIKIFNPPQGRHSPKTDEWCFTYCTQSVTGRFHGKLPSCQSVCIRKVFPHEVRNIVSFKRHQVGPDGKAKYPLPPEGQPNNLPRLLGGKPPVNPDIQDDDDDYVPKEKAGPPEVKHWDEGWYLWSANEYHAAIDMILKMRMNVDSLHRRSLDREKAAARWLEYQQFLDRTAGQRDSGSIEVSLEEKDKQWYGIRPPLRPTPDTTKNTMLIPIPLEVPTLSDRFNKLMEPTRKVLSITRESFTSGEQKQFASRVWEKARSDEPWVLASRTCQRIYEIWKKPGDGDDDDGSSRTSS